MYNRYVPQSDGSFRRSHIPDPPVPSRKEAPCKEPPGTEICLPETNDTTAKKPVCPPVKPRQNSARPKASPNRCDNCPDRKNGSIGGFLKSLLPKDFDSGDLLVVLLLLLMAGDCQEDQNSALLTLVLYLFL